MNKLKNWLKNFYTVVQFYRTLRSWAAFLGYNPKPLYRRDNYFVNKSKLTSNQSSLMIDQLIVLGTFKNKRYKVLASPGNLIETHIYAHGAWELRLLDFIYDYLQDSIDKKTVMLDIGANIGATTIPLARCFPSVEFVAIEANSAIANRLAKNCKLNSLSNVAILNKIATSEKNPPEMTFYAQPISDVNTGLSSVRKNFDLKNFEATKVGTITVDSLVKNLNGTVKIIKIDVQGEELNVLQSSIDTLRKFKPIVIFEFEEEYLSDSEKTTSKGELTNLFGQLDYSLYGFVDDISIAKISFGSYFHGDLVAIPN